MAGLVTIAVMFALARAPVAQVPAPQKSGLQIVVIKGEDAINVIQQKTAVAPVVEVRDRNGLPVPGAMVTFAIEGGKAASFPGAASTVTVATNAAGQATAAAINPLAAGSFQIQVQAAFQGQTVVATIAQSNVLTVAEAAATSASTAGTSAATGGATTGAGGGGGISATTLGVVGAAVGGGALVATQAAGNDASAITTPTTRTLTGPLAGTLVHNVNPTGGAPCTIDHALRGDATMSLTIQGDTVTGSLRFAYSDTPVAFTCNVTQIVTGSDSLDGPVTGTPSALSFRRSTNTPHTIANPPGATEIVDATYIFSGAFDGAIVTGALVFERTIVIAVGGAVIQSTNARVTIPLILR